MVTNRRITWRPGGLRRSTDWENKWRPENGWTGFVQNIRTVEEPNLLTSVIKAYLSIGYECWINGFDFPVDSHREVYEAVLERFFSVREDLLIKNLFSENEERTEDLENITILIRFAPEGSDKPSSSGNWVLVRPVGRMTPYESWIVSSDLTEVQSQFTFVTAADD